VQNKQTAKATQSEVRFGTLVQFHGHIRPTLLRGPIPTIPVAMGHGASEVIKAVMKDAAPVLDDAKHFEATRHISCSDRASSNKKYEKDFRHENPGARCLHLDCGLHEGILAEETVNGRHRWHRR
ncbi:unnamed protein product, partial [Prorocentrum cordatum]